jgi:hypothetical protein
MVKGRKALLIFKQSQSRLAGTTRYIRVADVLSISPKGADHGDIRPVM